MKNNISLFQVFAVSETMPLAYHLQYIHTLQEEGRVGPVVISKDSDKHNYIGGVKR
jgi:hypothetical protein